MEQLADKYESIVNQLKDLARELRIRSPSKLLAVARSKIPRASLKLAQLALEDNAGNRYWHRPIGQRGKALLGVPTSDSKLIFWTTLKIHVTLKRNMRLFFQMFTRTGYVANQF